MPELQTSDAQKLADWMKLNNLEVSNNVQLCAILFKQEEILRQVITLNNANTKMLEDKIRLLELWVSHD